MFKKLILFFLILLTIGFLLDFYIFNPQNIYKNISSSQFIKYKLYWWIFPLGEARIIIKENGKYNSKPAILLQAKAKTTGIIDKLLPLKADLQSIVDKRNFLPFVYKETISKKGKKDTKTVFYDQEKHIMKSKKGKYVILPSTFDPLSGILYISNIISKKKNMLEINVNSNQSNYLVKLEVTNASINFKNERLFKIKGISSRRKGEKARHRINFVAYLSEKYHIPISVKVFTPLGPARAKLIAYP
jgi:hypothetical protein